MRRIRESSCAKTIGMKSNSYCKKQSEPFQNGNRTSSEVCIDCSRLNVLQSLDFSSVLIVQDFAMKFMPSWYREAQSDFFGKLGISWHVSVCHRKIDERLEAQTFIHILESGLQDSEAVVLIMDHVLRSLKKQHPEITSAYFRQDNAGCVPFSLPEFFQCVVVFKGGESILVIHKAAKVPVIVRPPKLKPTLKVMLTKITPLPLRAS